MDNSWLTEDYLNAIGYSKEKDDGQYGIYTNKAEMVTSRTYGLLPPKYRKLIFNRDAKYGVFLGVRADWDTRDSVKNTLIINQQEFETLLNCCT